MNFGDIVYSTPGWYAGFVAMIGFSDPMHVRTIVEDVLRKLKEMERVQEGLKALEKEYEFGRIQEKSMRS